MTPEQAINHFGSQIKLAKALKECTQQAVSKWVANDKIPSGRQFEIQVVTNCALLADDSSLKDTARLNLA